METKVCTLLLLVRDDKIILAMKKRGFGAGKLTGTGGKVESGESIEQALVREAQEEIGVTPTRYTKVAENDFLFLSGKTITKRMYTHIYTCDAWAGNPTESEEMAPEWFDKSAVPYDTMWPDDRFWLPRVLKGEKVLGTFTFNEQNEMMSHDVRIFERLPGK